MVGSAAWIASPGAYSNSDAVCLCVLSHRQLLLTSPSYSFVYISSSQVESEQPGPWALLSCVRDTPSPLSSVEGTITPSCLAVHAGFCTRASKQWGETQPPLPTHQALTCEGHIYLEEGAFLMSPKIPCRLQQPCSGDQNLFSPTLTELRSKWGRYSGEISRHKDVLRNGAGQQEK